MEVIAYIVIFITLFFYSFICQIHYSQCETSGTDNQIACDNYTWIDGVTYTTSNNTATFTLTNVAGCDSLVTLNLTINNSNSGVDNQIACDSFT